MKWTHHLADGICRECLLSDEIKLLRTSNDNLRLVVKRLCLALKSAKKAVLNETKTHP